MLGGCSSHSECYYAIVQLCDDACISVDGMGYTRGSRDDWDRWAEVTGDENLSWDKMFPLMLKVGSSHGAE